MALRFLPKKQFVNLEIKDYVIRYVEAKQTVPPRPSSFGETYLPPGVVKNGLISDPKTFEVILRNCIRKWGLQQKAVRFLVPDAYVAIRKHMISTDITEEELRGYIFMELGRSIHLPFDNPIFDYAIVAEQEKEREIVIFAAPEELVQSYVDIFEKVKLRPAAVDIAALSLYQLHYHLDEPQDEEELLLVRLDMFHATITIFQNHVPLFMQQQSMSYGVDFETEHASIELKPEVMLPAMEELMEGIERILHFYTYSLQAGGGTISKMLLVGDHPLMNIAREIFTMRFSFRIDRMNYAAISIEEEDAMHPKYYPSLGLALKGV